MGENGLPLQYIFEARTDNGEAYCVLISVFVSDFDVQYLTVALKATPPSYRSSATGLFMLTEADVDAAANGRLRQSNVDDVIHRIVAPQYRLTDEQDSAFKYSGISNVSGPEDVYDAASTDRYLATAATLLDD